MELIRGIYNLRKRHHGCVVTIGNFDGVHVGHQQLIHRLTTVAKQYQLPSCVITFEPHPYEFFGVDVKPRLTKLRGKLEQFKELGVDRVLCLRFDQQLAAISAQDFIAELLVKQLGVQYILIGDDFKFGHHRAGDFTLLQQHSEQFGYQLEAMATVKNNNGIRISSTNVRTALENDDLKLAEQMLGRTYSMSGKVAHGNKRGRIIGFPTANIFLHRKAVPIHGVYCVTISGIADKIFNGVANVGNRPTVDGSRSLLEVHLFDFDQEIYGEHVEVAFVHKLRNEEKYDSFELLKQQIMKDADQARAFFASSIDINIASQA